MVKSSVMSGGQHLTVFYYVLGLLQSFHTEPWQGLRMARSVSSVIESISSHLGTLNSNASLR